MRTEHLWECLRGHQSTEAAAEAEKLTAIEERERGSDKWGEEGKERYQSKCEIFV